MAAFLLEEGAELTESHCRVLKQHVKQLVQQSLQLSVQYGLTTIAFPPLGVGRRFGYGRYTVASAMMSAFQEFLQTNPDSLQVKKACGLSSNMILLY